MLPASKCCQRFGGPQRSCFNYLPELLFQELQPLNAPLLEAHLKSEVSAKPGTTSRALSRSQAKIQRFQQPVPLGVCLGMSAAVAARQAACTFLSLETAASRGGHRARTSAIAFAKAGQPCSFLAARRRPQRGRTPLPFCFKEGQSRAQITSRYLASR